jgi:hypothetical protein
MTVPETEILIDPAALPLAEPPPVPVLPVVGPKRGQTLRAYAERTVDRLGPAATLWLVATLEELVDDARERAP